MDQQHVETAADAATAATGSGVAKAAPLVAISAADHFIMPLSDWVLLGTLAYTLLSLITLWRDKWGGRGQMSAMRRKLRTWFRKP